MDKNIPPKDFAGTEEDAFAATVQQALHHREAPVGFSDRLMERVAAATSSGTAARPDKRTHAGSLLHFSRPVWAGLAAAAMLTATVGTVHVERVRHDEQRAVQASAQFDTALKVTDRALNHVSAKLESTEFGELQRAIDATNRGGK